MLQVIDFYGTLFAQCLKTEGGSKRLHLHCTATDDRCYMFHSITRKLGACATQHINGCAIQREVVIALKCDAAI